VSNEGAIAFDFDLPAIDGIERRRTKNSTGPKVETCVMKRAADRRAFGKPVTEIAAVMRAGASDGEQLAVKAREQYRLVADAAGDRSLGGNPVKLYSLREVGSRCAA
jgi:hypothetical protein